MSVAITTSSLTRPLRVLAESLASAPPSGRQPRRHAPAFGHLSDLVGRKPVWLAGLATFTVGSMVCGAAPSLALLVLARAFQGFGGALIFCPRVGNHHRCLPARRTRTGLRRQRGGVRHGYGGAFGGSGARRDAGRRRYPWRHRGPAADLPHWVQRRADGLRGGGGRRPPGHAHPRGRATAGRRGHRPGWNTPRALILTRSRRALEGRVRANGDDPEWTDGRGRWLSLELPLEEAEDPLLEGPRRGKRELDTG